MAEENDEIGKKLDLADGWLTKFGNILKKHWGKLLLIVVCYMTYYAMTHPDSFIKQPPKQEIIVIMNDSLQQDSTDAMMPDSLNADSTN